MKQIPFYANREDNMSCMLSCLRSALEYYTGRQYSWEELEKLTGFKHGKAAWTVKQWLDLAEQGYDVRMIENFDYRRYQREGEVYLREFMQPEQLQWQLEHTNILEIQPLLPAFLQTVAYIQKSPTLYDVDQMLAEDYLVIVQLNSRTLNGKEGYVAHAVLVQAKDGDDYIAHDPGLPGVPDRRIPAELLFRAMGGQNNTTEIAGLKPKA